MQFCKYLYGFHFVVICPFLQSKHSSSYQTETKTQTTIRFWTQLLNYFLNSKLSNHTINSTRWVCPVAKQNGTAVQQWPVHLGTFISQHGNVVADCAMHTNPGNVGTISQFESKLHVVVLNGKLYTPLNKRNPTSIRQSRDIFCCICTVWATRSGYKQKEEKAIVWNVSQICKKCSTSLHACFTDKIWESPNMVMEIIIIQSTVS